MSITIEIPDGIKEFEVILDVERYKKTTDNTSGITPVRITGIKGVPA